MAAFAGGGAAAAASAEVAAGIEEPTPSAFSSSSPDASGSGGVSARIDFTLWCRDGGRRFVVADMEAARLPRWMLESNTCNDELSPSSPNTSSPAPAGSPPDLLVGDVGLKDFGLVVSAVGVFAARGDATNIDCGREDGLGGDEPWGGVSAASPSRTFGRTIPMPGIGPAPSKPSSEAPNPPRPAITDIGLAFFPLDDAPCGSTVGVENLLKGEADAVVPPAPATGEGVDGFTNIDIGLGFVVRGGACFGFTDGRGAIFGSDAV